MKQLLLLICLGMLLSTSAYAAEKSVQLAAFDHGRLNASSKCIKCHNRDQPDDDRHRQTQANCSTCHNTQSWKPASVDSNEGVK
jgi:hypothetical protein